MGLFDRSPAEEAARDARKALERAAEAYEDHVKRAREAFADAHAAWNLGAQKANDAARAAMQPRPVFTLELKSTLVLTETTLRTKQGEYDLTPDVHAHADQWGDIDTFTGGTSNIPVRHDNREVQIIVQGPGWSVVERYGPRPHLGIDPAPVFRFASAVNDTAARVPDTLLRMRDRALAAQRAIVGVLLNRDPVEQAVEAFVQATWAGTEVAEAQNAARLLLDGANAGDDRQLRKLAEAVEESRALVRRLGEEADAAKAQVAADSARARATAEQLAAELDARTAVPSDEPAPEMPEAPELPEPETATAEPDVLDQIRRLGELRDAGLVTPEEFEAKKAELLGRL